MTLDGTDIDINRSCAPLRFWCVWYVCRLRRLVLARPSPLRRWCSGPGFLGCRLPCGHASLLRCTGPSLYLLALLPEDLQLVPGSIIRLLVEDRPRDSATKELVLVRFPRFAPRLCSLAVVDLPRVDIDENGARWTRGTPAFLVWRQAVVFSDAELNLPSLFPCQRDEMERIGRRCSHLEGERQKSTLEPGAGRNGCNDFGGHDGGRPGRLEKIHFNQRCHGGGRRCCHGGRQVDESGCLFISDGFNEPPKFRQQIVNFASLAPWKRESRGRW